LQYLLLVTDTKSAAQPWQSFCMIKQLTIRGVPDEVSERLENLRWARGQSMNATILGILSASVEYDPRRKRLERLATWTEADGIEFERTLAEQRVIDAELWK
jgi:hypothetical protein